MSESKERARIERQRILSVHISFLKECLRVSQFAQDKLRRELAKRDARTRRIVKKLRDDRFDTYKIYGTYRHAFMNGYKCMCIDLLAALRGKGTR